MNGETVLRGDGLLRAIFESSSVGMVVGGPDGRPRRANPALERMLGYREAELVAMTFADFSHPDDVATDVTLFAQLVSGTRDHYQHDKRYLRKDGSVMWARVEVSIHRGAEGPLIIGMIQDISAHRASEARQEDLVHALAERVKELTALHRAARLLLVTDSPIAVLLRELVGLLPPAMQFPELATACVRYRDERQATAGHQATPWMLAVPFETSDGGTGAIEVAYHGQRWDSGTRAFMPEEDALMASLADMLRSALDRRRAERAMHAVNDRLELALATAGMGVWEWDLGRDEVHWSEPLARMVGLPGARSTRRGELRRYFHPDDLAHLFDRFDQAIANRADQIGFEVRLLRPSGGWRNLTGKAHLARNAFGAVTQVVAALLDVSEQRALEEQVRQAQKLESLGQVAGGVAHDFNNLLAIVTSGVELIRGEMPADHPWREIIDDLTAAGERGIALTRQLLAFSRKAVFQPTAVDVGQLVARFEPLLVRIAHRQVKVRLDLDPAAGRVWADPNQLEQVVMNLVVNARDAMPDGGTVTVSTAVADGDAAAQAGAPPGRYAMIAVRDTGPGIDPVVQGRIFEPFFTTKAPGQGTGLGLAVVSGVARQWHGYVGVDSAPGAGATFRVLLPQLPPDDQRSVRATGSTALDARAAQ